MFGYITLGTNDLDKAKKFYDELFLVLDYQRLFGDHFIAWGKNQDSPMLSVTKPFDEKEATVGNGVMIALKVESNELVDKFYQKAIELGASDEGKPGFRTKTYYGAYFRDLDGNKINIHFSGRKL